MIAKALDQITEAELNGLITAGVSERKTLDYKQQLPNMNDAGKRELLADVSSFANTAGGDLIFGMTEDAGVPTAIPGVQIGDPDQEVFGSTTSSAAVYLRESSIRPGPCRWRAALMF